MMDFLENIMCQFGNWAKSLVVNKSDLGCYIANHPKIDENTKSAYLKWSNQVRDNFGKIDKQLNVGYDLPELEMLRVETCFSIINGHWQSAVCLTNILLEAFLKLALVYSNINVSGQKNQPLSDLINSLSAPNKEYMQMNLSNTINEACKQKLIDTETKNMLHLFRERFRNSFFHADMQKMFGEQTIPVTSINCETSKIEHNDIPIKSIPLLLGDGLWQNAQANATPYFKKVDELIRETLPKVFPQVTEDKEENLDG